MSVIADRTLIGARIDCVPIRENFRLAPGLAPLSLSDPLTGLGNRRFFERAIRKAGLESGVDGVPFVVTLLDIERFGRINASLGFEAGDIVLSEVGLRLLECVELLEDAGILSVAAARLEGDSFGLLLRGRNPQHVISAVADRVANLQTQPVRFRDHEIPLSIAAGIAVSPDLACQPEMVLQRAYHALTECRRLERNVSVFDEKHEMPTPEALDTEVTIRRALDRGEFELHYQPIVSSTTGRVAAAEALLRWRQPGGRVVPAGSFIGIAEDIGLVVPICQWTLATAIDQLREWHQMDHRAIRMCVNVSARQFESRDAVRDLRDLLPSGEEHLVSSLELEMTERVFMEATPANIATLEEFKSLGITLAMDDFGTGFSSLSCLHRLPFDRLKIDQSFVSRAVGDRRTESVVRAIVQLGHALGLSIVAEGIESQAQAQLMTALGCEELQGYLLGRPQPAIEFEAGMVA